MKYVPITLLFALCSSWITAQELTRCPLRNAQSQIAKAFEFEFSSLGIPEHSMRFQSQDSVVFAVESGKVIKDFSLDDESSRTLIQKVNDSIFVVYSGLKKVAQENLKGTELHSEKSFALAEKNKNGLYEISITLFCRTRTIQLKKEEFLP